MDSFEPHKYGHLLSGVLNGNRCRPLGKGNPVDTMLRSLRGLSVEDAFSGFRVIDGNMAKCCLSGIWLLYDFLDESHRLSQDIATLSGSFWHGIMHRREGDFGNAKYWFRQVGDHPIFPELHKRAMEIAERDPEDDAIDQLAALAQWDPYQFVDLCEAAESGVEGIVQECELIQQAEWELLFDYCFTRAIDTRQSISV